MLESPKCPLLLLAPAIFSSHTRQSDFKYLNQMMLLSSLKSSTSMTYLRLKVVIYLCLKLPFSLVSGHSVLGSLTFLCLLSEYECLTPSHNSGLSSLFLAWPPNLHWLPTSCMSLWIISSIFTFFIALISTEYVLFTCLTVFSSKCKFCELT